MTRSAKTQSVMSLVTGERADRQTADNAEEKNARRRKHVLTQPIAVGTGNEPMNPALKAALEVTQSYSRPKTLAYQIVDISAMLVAEQLGAAIERFHVCSCDRCCEEITARAMKQLPRIYMHVRSADDEKAVNQRLEQTRAEVVKVLARVIISMKTTPVH